MDAGVDNVLVNRGSDNDNVYNLQGIRIGKRSDLKSLPQGLYIVGNKIIAVRYTFLNLNNNQGCSSLQESAILVILHLVPISMFVHDNYRL